MNVLIFKFTMMKTEILKIINCKAFFSDIQIKF
jgi:hypothetical protein